MYSDIAHTYVTFSFAYSKTSVLFIYSKFILSKLNVTISFVYLRINMFQSEFWIVKFIWTLVLLTIYLITNVILVSSNRDFVSCLSKHQYFSRLSEYARFNLFYFYSLIWVLSHLLSEYVLVNLNRDFVLIYPKLKHEYFTRLSKHKYFTPLSEYKRFTHIPLDTFSNNELIFSFPNISFFYLVIRVWMCFTHIRVRICLSE